MSGETPQVLARPSPGVTPERDRVVVVADDGTRYHFAVVTVLRMRGETFADRRERQRRRALASADLRAELRDPRLTALHVLHRRGAPAVEFPGGRRDWYLAGRRHRPDGPAVERSEDSLEWWRHGSRHRSDGPAVISPTGRREWWIEGKRHRDGLPAVERANGTLEYWRDGVRHRDHDLPAIEWASGRREWFWRGVRHRDGGPALVEGEVAEWFHDGLLHREGGPAVRLEDGTEVYWLEGRRHRVDGPAVIAPSGHVRYFLDDERMTHDEWLADPRSISLPETVPVQVTGARQALRRRRA